MCSVLNISGIRMLYYMLLCVCVCASEADTTVCMFPPGYQTVSVYVFMNTH